MNKKTLQVFMHVPYEALGSMEGFFSSRGYQISYTKFYQGDSVPDPANVDLLVVMGGPMSVHDTQQYPWLLGEKAFLREYLKTGKKALGICLGAQLLSEVLGGAVTQGHQKEIGWYPLSLPPSQAGSPGLEAKDNLQDFANYRDVLPLEGEVFHWHGETFSIPEECQPLLSSEICTNQAFALGSQVLALQFHLETTAELAENLILHSHENWGKAPGVQSQEGILASQEDFLRLEGQMATLLERFLSL